MSDSKPTDDGRNFSLPARVIVSLRAGFVLAIANVLCVAILAWAFIRVKGEPQSISVTGSAKKAIQSDLIVWRGKVTVNNKNLVAGYQALKEASDKTVKYLEQQKVPAGQIKLYAITTARNLARDAKGNTTDEVTSFDLSQTVEITSHDVKGVGEVASRVTELIKDGVMLESQAPEYLYTKLADLKVEMLAAATKDAASRAKQIAENSGASIGSIKDARMGVMQINPVNSNNEVSGYGNNDTSSYEKEITAVVSARFALE